VPSSKGHRHRSCEAGSFLSHRQYLFNISKTPLPGQTPDQMLCLRVVSLHVDIPEMDSHVYIHTENQAD
jgi:hypothetical protein